MYKVVFFDLLYNRSVLFFLCLMLLSTFYEFGMRSKFCNFFPTEGINFILLNI